MRAGEDALPHKGEDDDGEIETVYRANGGVPGSLVFMRDPSALLLNDEGFARLRRALFKSGARFVVMDALFYFLEGLIKSTNEGDQIVPILQRLNGLAKEKDCTFLNCRHTKKLGGAAGAKVDPAELGMGTQMVRNKHRGQWVARWHPKKKGVVVVTNEKDSLLYLGFESFAYQRLGNEVALRPNDADGFRPDGERLEKMAEKSKARDVILEVCLPGVPVLTSTLNKAASEANVSMRTLERARAEMGVKPYGKEKGKSDRPARNMVVLPLSDTQEVDEFYES